MMKSESLKELSRVFDNFKKNRQLENSNKWKKVQAFMDVLMVLMWVCIGTYYLTSGKTVEEMMTALNAITIAAVVLTTAIVSLFDSIMIILTNEDLGVDDD